MPRATPTALAPISRRGAPMPALTTSPRLSFMARFAPALRGPSPLRGPPMLTSMLLRVARVVREARVVRPAPPTDSATGVALKMKPSPPPCLRPSPTAASVRPRRVARPTAPLARRRLTPCRGVRRRTSPEGPVGVILITRRRPPPLPCATPVARPPLITKGRAPSAGPPPHLPFPCAPAWGRMGRDMPLVGRRLASARPSAITPGRAAREGVRAVARAWPIHRRRRRQSSPA